MLLNIDQAARLLRVEREVVEEWVALESVPFAERPDGEVVMPLGGLQTAIVERGLLDV